MKEIVHTEDAPGAIGPYSQAVIANGFVYTSGQIPMDPKTGGVVEGSVGQQTGQVMKNLQAVLQSAGSSFENVVKTVIFLKDMEDFAEVNRVYEEALGTCSFPARSTVEVSRLPRDVKVEIEMIALVK